MKLPFGHCAVGKQRAWLGWRLLAVLAVFAVATPALVGEEPPPPFAPACPQTGFEAPEGSWTLVVLPDTQHYSAYWPDVFYRQTEWIAANRDQQRIRFVAHEGDITNDNTPAQWEVARRAMGTLEAAGIPYALVPGNKDLGKNASDRDASALNRTFSRENYRHSTACGFFEDGKLENSWHTFDAPTGKILVLALEFGPRDEVVDWANRIVAAHPDRAVIVLTHGYLDSDGTRLGTSPKQSANPKRYGLARASSVNDGEDLWKKLVSVHPNIFLVLNGHCTGSGAARLESKGVYGNTVWQIFANYQQGVKPDLGYGGGGYLRLLRFNPDGKTVTVRTYSPWYDKWLNTPGQEFEILLGPVNTK